MFSSKKELHNKSTKDAWVDYTSKYVQGKLSPLAQDAIDVGTHHDYNGNTLPFYNDKPIHSYNKKLTWPEYSTKYLPIPFEGMFDNVKSEMENNGLSKPDAITLTKGIFSGAVEGTLGVQVKEDFSTNEKKSSFTNEVLKNSTFKYFSDKGLELPNTAHTSESILNEKKGTEYKLSDYPQDIQDQYDQIHKQELDKALSSIDGRKEMGNKQVYVKTVKDAQGNNINTVSLTPPATKYKKVKMDDLSKDELAQVLHLAQSQATTNAKQKILKVINSK